jgi:phosphate transport system permease protein
MQPRRTFTGRARGRRTNPWVRAGDVAARTLITFGGIGTIVAVLLVAVFLLSVALPLFRSARVVLERSATVPLPGLDRETGSSPVALGADESGGLAWVLGEAAAGAGSAGRIEVVSLADGGTLLERPAAESGLAGVTAVKVLSGRLQAAAGFADGGFRVGRLGLESTFLADGDLPAEFAGLAPGEARRRDDGIVLRAPGGQHATVRLVAEFPDAGSTPLPAPIIDVDLTVLAAGPLVAALDAEGRVRIEAASSRRNLLTDQVVTTSVGATIEPAGGEGAAGGVFVPRFVRLSELGDQLFLFAADGAARRYEIRDVEAPVLMESFAATPAGVPVTDAAHMFGGGALAVAAGDGAIRLLFTARTPAAAAGDGLVTVGARLFPAAAAANPAAVTAMASSPRSRLFAVADAAGGIRLLQSTTGATAASVSGTAAGGLGGPARALAITPRENRLLAVDGDRLAVWSLEAGYQEVSLAALFGRVWYERYPEPVHAWETTGHEAFESKFGLVPLVFGTIKATFYSMLFATPVAILAAIYASQFMPPRWRSRIKPAIEMMASLPSVVLGFVAGLVLAPLVERMLMPVLAALFCVPLAIVTGAHLWQLMPAGWRGRLAPWRFATIALGALPIGCLAAARLAGPLERLLFQGNVAAWLDGRGGSGFGGWVLALLPLAGILATMLVGRVVNPWLRRQSVGWSARRAAVASLAAFLLGLAVTVALAVAAAALFDSLRLDTRGGVFGTYVQRNAFIVAIGMSFAIIPLIFTIADDALSSVPDHLRSASLGAGATPWQTAVRVIVPAAASGLFSAVMIGLGRAVGETMIVLMAAGNTPLMGWNIFNGFQTLSAAIATELPEAARGSVHYRVLFLAALTLFAMTFVVNTVAELVRQRFRRRSHEL